MHSNCLILEVKRCSNFHIIIFAVCEWPQRHPSQHVMGKPVEVWCRNLFEAIFNCFLPIENTVCGVIVAFDTLEEDNVLVVIPVVR